MDGNSEGRVVSLIEPHDGVISRIALVRGGMAEIVFDRLSIYEQKGTEHYAIWTYGATVKLGGVRSLSVDGTIERDGRVDDATITSRGGALMDWRDLLSSVDAVAAFSLTLTSGTTVIVGCSSAQLLLQERIKYIEDWKGSLY